MGNDVIYPGGVTVSDALHTALQGVNQHPQGGQHSVASAALAAAADAEKLSDGLATVPQRELGTMTTNDVMYPGGVVVSDALHSVLYNIGAQPKQGQHSPASAALAALKDGVPTNVPPDHAVTVALAIYAFDKTITDAEEASEE
jgi:hypothetical protein